MIDDGHLDLSSHDAFSGGVPHRTFARLRAEDPVHWTPSTTAVAGSGRSPAMRTF